jgi:protocatechuate 3,4-dioxygenase beta subunit
MSATPLVRLLRRAARPAVLSLLCLSLCVLLVPQSAFGQVLYGTLTGTVTDPSGAGLPKASVEALNTGTGATTTQTTDDRGTFLFNDLLPGNYNVTVTASGFAKYTAQVVVLLANQTRRIDVAMALAQTSEHIEVVASAIALQTDRADVNTQLDAKDRA